MCLQGILRQILFSLSFFTHTKFFAIFACLFLHFTYYLSSWFTCRRSSVISHTVLLGSVDWSIIMSFSFFVKSSFIDFWTTLYKVFLNIFWCDLPHWAVFIIFVFFRPSSGRSFPSSFFR